MGNEPDPMPEATLENVVIDIQTRAFHLWSSDDDCQTVDCSDSYEDFLALLELIRGEQDRIPNPIKYAPPSDFLEEN